MCLSKFKSPEFFGSSAKRCSWGGAERCTCLSVMSLNMYYGTHSCKHGWARLACLRSSFHPGRKLSGSGTRFDTTSFLSSDGRVVKVGLEGETAYMAK